MKINVLGTCILSLLIMASGSISIMNHVHAEPHLESSELLFKDVHPSYWGYQTIKWGIENKKMTGYPDNTIRPTELIKESEFVTLLVKNYLNSTPSDTSGQHWAEPYYREATERNWLDKKGIVDKPITRGDVAKLVASSQGYHHDIDNSIQFLLNHQLANGKTDATVEGFDKGAFVTRIEAMQLLKNLHDQGYASAKVKPASPSPALIKQGPSLFVIESNDKAGLFGLIDRNGKTITQPKYKTVMVPNGNQPILVSSKENEYYYIKKDGSTAFPEKYRNAGVFSEGLAAVQLPTAKHPHLFGYINESGQVVIPPKYVGASEFSQGYAKVEYIEPGKPTVTQGIIDRNGKLVASVDYDVSRQLVSYYDGIMLILRGKEDAQGEYLFTDTNGNQVSTTTFFHVSPFSEGLAAVQVDQENWGYVDSKGKLVISATFSIATEFSEGVAAVGIKTNNGIKFGYIDYKGDWVIEPIYDYATPFSEGWSSVKIVEKSGYINKRNEWQLTNIPYIIGGEKFPVFGPFKNGLAYNMISNGTRSTAAYIDKSGAIIWRQDPDFTLP